MYSVLMNAVLSSAPDYERLFESLSWSSDSWPGPERVDALTAFIEGLRSSMADGDTTRFSDASRKLTKEKTHSVIWQQCLPLFSTFSPRASDGMRQRESVASACRLLSACLPLCDESVSESFALSVLPSLGLSEEEVPGLGRLSVEVACEVMAALIPSLWQNERLRLTILSSALSCIRTLPDTLVSKVMTRLLLPLLGCSSDETLGGILKSILDDLCHWYSTERSPVVTERTLLCLTVLSDHIMKPHGFASCSDPRLSPQFWAIVQDGLMHRDSVSRKRALYLLKQCLALSEDEGVECPLSTSGDGKYFVVCYYLRCCHLVLHLLFPSFLSCRGAFVQVDPSQEKVAPRVLGGFCAGDGDPGGKSGRKKPPASQPSWLASRLQLCDTCFCRFTSSVQF